MTQEQINSIRQGLGEYATYRRFVARRGKEPIDPITGYGAKANDRTTWGALDQALHAMSAYDCDGIGVELGDKLCGVDIDHCINEKGEVSEKAKEIISVMDSYVETSPSGTGIHILFTGSIPDGARRKDGLEMYAEGRYFTLTGNGSGILNERTEQAAQIHKKYLKQTLALPKDRLPSAEPLILSDDPDDILLEKMFKARNGAAVTALWHGDITAYGGDDSRADSALCFHLAFWTHGDADRIDRLFRMSALMRPKWDEKHGVQTYGQLTISHTLESQKSYAITRDFASVTEAHSIQPGQSDRQLGFSLITAIDPLTDEKRYPWNDTGSGALFADTYKNVARYVPQAVSWYIYERGAWRVDEGGLRVAELTKALVNHMISCAANITDDDRRAKYLSYTAKMSSNKSREAMAVSARSIYPIQITEFDKNPYLFNCQNGTFNLQLFKLEPHKPSDFLSKITNVDYLPNVTCTRWDEFIDEIMQNDQEKSAYLRTAIGYAMTGLHNQKCFFILHGKQTNNGKSTFMDAILNVMGDYAKVSQADIITSKQYAKDSSSPSEDIARLAGARLVSMAEPDKSARLNVGLIKQMTGNDLITARFLRQNSFQFMPQFKIFLHANDLPQTTDDTIFASGRVKIIEFNREFTPQEQDKNLESIFKEDYNASAILNWIMEGARSFLCEGLNDSVSIQAAVAAYRAESDIVGNFINDCFEPMQGKFVLASAAYQKYQLWCQRFGYQSMNLKNLCRELRRKLEIQHTRNGAAIMNYRINDAFFASQDFYQSEGYRSKRDDGDDM